MDALLEKLYADHREALGWLADLAAAGDDLAADGPTAAVWAALADGARHLDEDLSTHFDTEEQALFPVLGRVLGTDGGPVAVMLAEHQEFRRLRDQYRQHLGAVAGPGAAEATAATRRAAADLAALLHEHIAKEDRILFPLAQELLTPADWDEVRRLAATLPG